MKSRILDRLLVVLTTALVLAGGVIKMSNAKEAAKEMPPKSQFSLMDYFENNWRDYLDRQNTELARDQELQQKFNQYVARFDQYKDLPLLEKAKMVDAIVDADMVYITDSLKCGQSEYWETPASTSRDLTGDCEGYASLKYKIMNSLGVPDNQLGILFVPGHAVALVRDVQGRDTTDYILDGDQYTFTVTRECPVLTIRDTLSLKEYVAAGYPLDTISLGRVLPLSDSKYTPEFVFNLSGVKPYAAPVSVPAAAGSQPEMGPLKTDLKLNKLFKL